MCVKVLKMAHTCPDCGLLCHCGGDIDDIDFGDDTPEAAVCTHCDCPICREPKGMCDCDPYEFEEDEGEP
jgi:hypothetical protein